MGAGRLDPSLHEVSIRAAADLDVRLCSPVQSIESDGAGVTVTYSSANRDTGQIWAKRAIVAVPPAIAAKVRYQPGLGGIREQLHQSLPMGSVIKVFALYDAPFWRDENLSGQAVSIVHQPSVMLDNSPADASCGVLVGFIEGKACREAQRMSDSDRRSMVTKTLTTYFGPKAADHIDYLEQDWTTEEWSGGCYGGRFTPGVWTQLGPALREPCDPIHWAGTETAENWMGYADGAIESGKSAAATYGSVSSKRKACATCRRSPGPARRLEASATQVRVAATCGWTGGPHSVVTTHPIDEAGEPTAATRDEILAYFKDTLSTVPAG